MNSQNVNLKWNALERAFRSEVEPAIRAWVPNDGPQYALQLEFAMNRLREGRSVAEYFQALSGGGGEFSMSVREMGA